ncbi:hypothetical protein BDP27DRAFT_1448946 [Rhodocollybia butyracea]|uniref:Uncharacterized protein n=1 Tax=Rhodocollybia butyracea TaxID=206335 RepID=A0A9P5U796_9AGAR|nr:hypothetical protein BDP27DRAFT_1448946 [Rhodocollybia butyracea]
MPPQKSTPKIYQMLIRANKTTVFVTVPPSTTIGSLKAEAFSALTSDLNEEEGIPKVSSVEEFHLCRVLKGKQREYEVLDEQDSIKNLKLANWEVLYVQFMDAKGDPIPIVASDPPVDDEDEETEKQ